MTPEEGHYVDLAKLDDETLRAAAAQGDESASEILRARQAIADALDEGIDAAADARTTRVRARDELTDRVLNRARTPAWDTFRKRLVGSRRPCGRRTLDTERPRVEVEDERPTTAGRGQDPFDAEDRRTDTERPPVRVEGEERSTTAGRQAKTD